MIGLSRKGKIMSEPVRCRCGGEAEIFHIAPEGYEGSYCVRCTECLIQTPFFNKDKDKAIEVWNRAMGERTAKVKDFGHPCGVYGYCSNCGGYCVNEEPYCPHCGARLEWDE